MTLDECFAHFLWPHFEKWLWSRHQKGAMFVYVEHEEWWRPLWDCFLAGSAARAQQLMR